MPTREFHSAVVIGATGLVGRECLEQLVAQPEFETITALVRRPLPDDLRSPKLRTVLVDFDRLDDRRESIEASHLFCALGTTLEKAGSRERFRQVDFGYTLRVAQLARSVSVRHLLLVSTAGASPDSRAFYLRVKGELERAITALAFRSTTVVRPSWLVGNRSEFRLREEIPLRLAWALPRKYRPVRARDVASALVAAAVADRPGLRVIENPEVSRRSVRPERGGDFGRAGTTGTSGTEGERK